MNIITPSKRTLKAKARKRIKDGVPPDRRRGPTDRKAYRAGYDKIDWNKGKQPPEWKYVNGEGDG